MVEFSPLTPQQVDALAAFLARVPVGPAEQVAMQSLQGWLRAAIARWQEAQKQQAEEQAQAAAETPAE